MKGYIIKYNDDLVSVTNDFEEWLKRNNERRVEEGEEPENKYTFQIQEIDLEIY